MGVEDNFCFIAGPVAVDFTRTVVVGIVSPNAGPRNSMSSGGTDITYI